ncbi:MAG: glycosyltransferase, partial [Anaerolineae bacterium]
ATRLPQILTTRHPDMSRRLWSPALRRRLEALLQADQFDVVQIEGIEMAPYLPTARKFAPRAKIVYDDHNAEWLFQQRNFITDVKIPRRWIAAAYSLVQTQRLKRYERQVCRQADAVIAVSRADREAILQLDPTLPVTVVPNGVDLAAHTRQPEQVFPFELVFTGKMDYRPNIDAMLWFCRQVLPLVLQQRPQTRLAIVGQRPHPRLDPLRRNRAITITGYVDDVRPYIAGAAVYVAPFRVGGGTRLKLLQAMAMRKAIVATTVGAEGYPVTPGREMILADDPRRMAAAIVQLLERPQERARLGEHAFQLVAARYTWESLIPKIEALYE